MNSKIALLRNPDKLALDRRSFLKTSAFAAAGLTLTRLPVMAGPFTRADFTKLVPEDKKLDPVWVQSLFARGTPEILRGAELKYVGMPIGAFARASSILAGTAGSGGGIFSTSIKPRARSTMRSRRFRIFR